MKRKLYDLSSPLLLTAVCVLISVALSLTTESFFSWKNAVNILEANSYRMLIALGMLLVMVSGAMDLSAGAILSLSAICMASALKAELPVWVCLIICAAAGLFLGAINGTLIHVTKINAFIITLGTSFLYRGLSLIITEGIPITRLPQGFRSFGCGDILGMESGVFMAIGAIVILVPLLYKMRWGSRVQSLGGNISALSRCGVRTGFYRISVFAVSGFLCAVAGVIVTARLNSAEANAGLNMEMDAICAVVMGGTPLHGGKARLGGTIVAVLLLGLIRNGLTILSVSSYYQQFVTGALLLLAVTAAELRERRSRLSAI